MHQEILTQAELIAQRLAGKLPHININGTDFTIDIRLLELRETESPWNRIDIRDLEPSADGDDQLFFYDTRKHCAYELDDGITEFPEHVVLAALPDNYLLDPVASARSVGYEETKFLGEYPIKQFLQAGITPIRDTFLPRMIEENIEKQHKNGGRNR